MSSYYTYNRLGLPLDRALLEKAAELTAGQGDGRVSRADAPELAEKVNDGGKRTLVEDRTVDKIYREVNFTPHGRDTFEHINRSEGAKRGWVTRRERAARIEASDYYDNPGGV